MLEDILALRKLSKMLPVYIDFMCREIIDMRVFLENDYRSAIRGVCKHCYMLFEKALRRTRTFMEFLNTPCFNLNVPIFSKLMKISRKHILKNTIAFSNIPESRIEKNTDRQG